MVFRTDRSVALRVKAASPPLRKTMRQRERGREGNKSKQKAWRSSEEMSTLSQTDSPRARVTTRWMQI